MRSLFRVALRRLAGFVSRSPFLVNVASRLLSRFPRLKNWLRRGISARPQPPARGEDQLTPDEARVLVDLRQASAARRPAPR
jgi:hypothetical protein